jgi:hypothetical protein
MAERLACLDLAEGVMRLSKSCKLSLTTVLLGLSIMFRAHILSSAPLSRTREGLQIS